VKIEIAFVPRGEKGQERESAYNLYLREQTNDGFEQACGLVKTQFACAGRGGGGNRRCQLGGKRRESQAAKLAITRWKKNHLCERKGERGGEGKRDLLTRRNHEI